MQLNNKLTIVKKNFFASSSLLHLDHKIVDVLCSCGFTTFCTFPKPVLSLSITSILYKSGVSCCFICNHKFNNPIPSVENSNTNRTYVSLINLAQPVKLYQIPKYMNSQNWLR